MPLSTFPWLKTKTQLRIEGSEKRLLMKLYGLHSVQSLKLPLQHCRQVFLPRSSTRCLSSLVRRPQLHLPSRNPSWPWLPTSLMTKTQSLGTPILVKPRNARLLLQARNHSNISSSRRRGGGCQNRLPTPYENLSSLISMLTLRSSTSLLIPITTPMTRRRISETVSLFLRRTVSSRRSVLTEAEWMHLYDIWVCGVLHFYIHCRDELSLYRELIVSMFRATSSALPAIRYDWES